MTAFCFCFKRESGQYFNCSHCWFVTWNSWIYCEASHSSYIFITSSDAFFSTWKKSHGLLFKKWKKDETGGLSSVLSFSFPVLDLRKKQLSHLYTSSIPCLSLQSWAELTMWSSLVTLTLLADLLQALKVGDPLGNVFPLVYSF